MPGNVACIQINFVAGDFLARHGGGTVISAAVCTDSGLELTTEGEIVLKHFTIRILLSMFLLVSVERTYAATPISDMRVDINTKGDDKDLNEPINIQILKDETAILYDSGWISELQFRKNKEWRAPGPGHPISFPFC
jgi:hypothetical protein